MRCFLKILLLLVAGGCTGEIGGSAGDSGGAIGAGTGAPADVGPDGAPLVDPKTGRLICSKVVPGPAAPLRLLTFAEYGNALADLFGVNPSDRYPQISSDSVTGFSTEPKLSAVGQQNVEDLLYAAEEAAESLAPRIGSLLTCAATASQACAETFLGTFGRRAFRRSLTSEERAGLIKVYADERADGATFAEAVAVMAAQMMQMPAFPYVVEVPASSQGLRLASRLAFHFWNSLPDDRLLDLAEGDGLAAPQAVATEAKRLVADRRSDRAFSRFFREWTQVHRLVAGEKDKAQFSYLNDAFMVSFNESFDRFAIDQVRSGGSFDSLLKTPVAFADANLAKFMGVSAGAGWTKVSLPPDRYSGIMTQPAMMAALAHSADSSYVFRGRFVRKRLLCDVLAPAPGNAMSEFATIAKPVDPTARELSDVVRARAGCGGCHTLMDPAGLAFEHFDAMGVYRERYRSGKAIDTNDSLAGVGDETLMFSGAADLIGQLAKQSRAQTCFARQIFRYTESREDTEQDACAIQRLTDALTNPDGGLERIFVEATQTDTFLYR